MRILPVCAHCPGLQRALELHPRVPTQLTTRSRKMQVGGEQVVPDPTNSKKGRCEGASQSANETVRQNVPQFQHDALMGEQHAYPSHALRHRERFINQKQTDGRRRRLSGGPKDTRQGSTWETGMKRLIHGIREQKDDFFCPNSPPIPDAHLLGKT